MGGLFESGQFRNDGNRNGAANWRRREGQHRLGHIFEPAVCDYSHSKSMTRVDCLLQFLTREIIHTCHTRNTWHKNTQTDHATVGIQAITLHDQRNGSQSLPRIAPPPNQPWPVPKALEQLLSCPAVLPGPAVNSPEPLYQS